MDGQNGCCHWLRWHLEARLGMEEGILDKHLGWQWHSQVAALGPMNQAGPRWPLRAMDGAVHFPSLWPTLDWIHWPQGRQRENLLLLFSQPARVPANRAPPSQAATSLSFYDPVRPSASEARREVLRESFLTAPHPPGVAPGQKAEFHLRVTIQTLLLSIPSPQNLLGSPSLPTPPNKRHFPPSC